MEKPSARKPWYRILYVQVLIAVFLGIVVGSSFAFFLAASLCVLGGSLLMRGTMLEAGNESAARPLDYFRFASERA